MLLNFGDQKRTSVFNMVWQLADIPHIISAYLCVSNSWDFLQIALNSQISSSSFWCKSKWKLMPNSLFLDDCWWSRKAFYNDFHFDLHQNELDYNATRLFLVKTINKPLEKNGMGIFRNFSSKSSIFCIKPSNKCHFSSFCDRKCFRYFATVDALHGLICGKSVLLRSWKPFLSQTLWY